MIMVICVGCQGTGIHQPVSGTSQLCPWCRGKKYVPTPEYKLFRNPAVYSSSIDCLLGRVLPTWERQEWFEIKLGLQFGQNPEITRIVPGV